MLLYTDGLVEQRNESLATGLERLRSAVDAGPHELGALCDAVLASVAGDDDDVALLAVRLR
jgi:hypothetical protein